jgi:signal transduction histidine kinase
VHEHLQDAMQLTELAVKTARNVAAALRPVELDMGFACALRSLVDRFSTFNGIQCNVTINELEVELEDSRTFALFRIVQESLTNIARHAQASVVDITLEEVAGEAVLRVRDNGVGFDTSRRKDGSFGLIGMRERAVLLGAQINVVSKPGQGTEILLHIPLQEVAENI